VWVILSGVLITSNLECKKGTLSSLPSGKCHTCGLFASRLSKSFPRNVKTDSTKTLDRAMESVKNKGFINYYGRSLMNAKFH